MSGPLVNADVGRTRTIAMSKKKLTSGPGKIGTRETRRSLSAGFWRRAACHRIDQRAGCSIHFLNVRMGILSDDVSPSRYRTGFFVEGLSAQEKSAGTLAEV